MKKSPVGSWRSFFNLGKSSSVSKRKLQRNESEPSEMKAMALKGECSRLPFPLRPERPAWGCSSRSVARLFSRRDARAPTGGVLTLLLGANCALPVLCPQMHSAYKCVKVPFLWKLYRSYIVSVCLNINSCL